MEVQTQTQAITQLLASNGAFSERDARLALDIVANTIELPEMLQRYSLTPQELKDRLVNPSFRALVEETRTVWTSDLNVGERVRLKAALLVEDSLLEIYRTIHDRKNPVLSRQAAFNALSKLASIEQKQQQAATGSRFVLNIAVGEDTPVTIDGTAEENSVGWTALEDGSEDETDED